MTNNDLFIFYDTLLSPNYIECKCSRWDIDNYNAILEVWLTKSQLNTLRNNIVPGAAGELFNILGKPFFYDQTWEGNNTVKLSPNTDTESTIPLMRNSEILYVKDISVTTTSGPSGYLNVKLEGYVSGSSL